MIANLLRKLLALLDGRQRKRAGLPPAGSERREIRTIFGTSAQYTCAVCRRTLPTAAQGATMTFRMADWQPTQAMTVEACKGACSGRLMDKVATLDFSDEHIRRTLLQFGDGPK